MQINVFSIIAFVQLVLSYRPETMVSNRHIPILTEVTIKVCSVHINHFLFMNTTSNKYARKESTVADLNLYSLRVWFGSKNIYIL